MAKFKWMVIVVLLAGFCEVSLAGPVAEANLVSWWKFDEGTGTIANDSAGDNDGTIIHPEWYSDPFRGMCLNFRGIAGGDYVSVADAPDLNITGDITISAWVYLRSFGGGGRRRSSQKLLPVS